MKLFLKRNITIYYTVAVLRYFKQGLNTVYRLSGGNEGQ